jgi:hypothetical protein
VRDLDPDVPKVLRMTLLGGEEVDLRIDRHDAQADGSGIVEGVALDEPGSHALLAYVDEAVAGTIFLPRRGLFQVRYAGNGEHRVSQLDPCWLPACGVGDDGAFVVPAGDEIPAPLAAPSRRKSFAATAAHPSTGTPETDALVPMLPGTESEEPPLAADAATTIELLVAYTTTAKTANGGDSGIAALINSAIATANTAHSVSLSGVSLRLAAKVEVVYTETGSLTTDLGRLQNTSDGHMDNLAALRSQYKADLVTLIVHSGGSYAGLAYLWSAGTSASGFSPWGYSTVVDAYADSYLTLAHELGHNMGCGHAAGDSGSGGAYSYSYGHRFSAGGTQYRTVMAYAPGTRIGYFSNPNVSYLGTATGTASANNAQTLINSKATIAAIQTGSTLYQEWVPRLATDLNADGKPDIVWRSSVSGRVIVWLMDGTTTLSTSVLWSGDAAWVPVTSADLNADNKPDILWRNSNTGRVIAWLMNGVTLASTVTLWSGDAAWLPIAAADFNANGKPDIIWRNSNTGRVVVWYMNDTTLASTAAVWSGDAAWVPIAAGDLNADGKPDLIWRNSGTGRVIVWLLNGITMSSATALWSGDSNWLPVATGDFNADTKPDLLWRHASTGRAILWFMNGVTSTSTTAIWGG